MRVKRLEKFKHKRKKALTKAILLFIGAPLLSILIGRVVSIFIIIPMILGK